MDFPGLLPTSGRLSSLYGVSAGKRDQIDKKFFFEIINVLDQMIKSTSILLKNFFLKKISIWFLFLALIPNIKLRIFIYSGCDDVAYNLSLYIISFAFLFLLCILKTQKFFSGEKIIFHILQVGQTKFFSLCNPTGLLF